MPACTAVHHHHHNHHHRHHHRHIHERQWTSWR
jgi:hypothetical protein